ncbi:class I SAM-dependent methyltransferase [Mongoliitalea lutea]|uniref:Methyltransferase domain-containing protein n=1 Tax=Mongoliitalea lutea TaxID=849756 RepID=A0A8J3CZS2_9BACT|nr:class I SAM-dependent methyltransferase [Mongoliitalea lutea]GHB49156.1 hypothetical protein GCM10008106_32440 [Mongoliitalea lutea]
MSHDNWSKLYDKVYQLTFGGIYESFTNTTLREINKILPAGSILDFGAGTGRLSIPLVQQGYEVIAVEQSSGMVDVFKEKCAEKGLTFPIYPCSIANYSNGSADLALAVFTVLSYIIDEEEMLKSLQNITDHLNPNGLFFFDLPDNVFFANPVLFNINRPDFQRKVTINPSGVHQIFNYREQGSLVFDGATKNYEDEFPIRQWDWASIDRLLVMAGLTNTGRTFPTFNGTGSTYKLYQKR